MTRAGSPRKSPNLHRAPPKSLKPEPLRVTVSLVLYLPPAGRAELMLMVDKSSTEKVSRTGSLRTLPKLR